MATTINRSLHWCRIGGCIVVTLRQHGHRFEFRCHGGGMNLVKLHHALIAAVNDGDLPFCLMDATDVFEKVLKLRGLTR